MVVRACCRAVLRARHVRMTEESQREREREKKRERERERERERSIDRSIALVWRGFVYLKAYVCGAQSRTAR